MLNFEDTASDNKDAKSARMDQRTTLHVKETVKLASSLLGIKESAFVSTAAFDRAMEVIGNYEKTILSIEDRDVFLAAFDASPTAPEALKQDNKLYAELVEDDI